MRSIVMEAADNGCARSLAAESRSCPTPPPLPGQASTNDFSKRERISSMARGTWDRLFDEGYRADVVIHTDTGERIYAHASVLGIASPVLRSMLRIRKGKVDRMRAISILGVPHEAVRLFIRFLYSSSFQEAEVKVHVIPLLVLSHAYAVSHVKQKCVDILDDDYLSTENVVDILQLALLCDAPRISLTCQRMIARNLREVSASEGWQAMKQSHPVLEKRLLLSIIEDEKMRKEKARRSNERRIYQQLYEAMEALVHICRDGCRTIAPRDKDFKISHDPCSYAACKGLESLIRHFAGCKLRVPGGCIHCRRMWQLLELHSRICADSFACRVPLCKNFKEKISKQSKKDEGKWRILVKNVLRTKSIGGSPLFVSAFPSTS